MSMRNLTNLSVAALAGATMLTLCLSPASAFTLSGPSLGDPVASAQVEKVWWDRWGNWHRNGHRVSDPSMGEDGDRRCWAGFNGVVHCREREDDNSQN
jgi:ABC-type glycerol-3-phosphate transport system substrate-binding protein